jgi:hypothetical protein
VSYPRLNNFFISPSPKLSISIIKKKKIKPFNDAEFVKRAAGRGPKAFLWSYDDDKA